MDDSPATNRPTPAETARLFWSRKPIACSVVLLLLLANLAAANLRGFWPWREILTLGLLLGQLGALAAWAFLAVRPHWAYRVATCYAAAAASTLVVDTSIAWNPTRMFFVMSIFLVYTTLTLGVILMWNVLLGLATSRGSDERAAAPRFQVRHLLIASVVVAVLSAIVKIALPGWDDAKLVRIFALLIESTLLSLAAYALVGKPPFRWSRLATLVAVGAVLAAAAFRLDDYFKTWSQLLYLNAIQIAVLYAVLVVARRDKPTQPIEPPESATSSAPE